MMEGINMKEEKNNDWPRVQLVGASNIPEGCKEQVEEIAEYCLQKIASRINPIELKATLHFKTYKKSGSRRKYSVNGKMFCSRLPLTYSHANEWDIVDATHEVLDSMKEQCLKNFERSHNIT
jgi:hypothetical protein